MIASCTQAGPKRRDSGVGDAAAAPQTRVPVVDGASSSCLASIKRPPRGTFNYPNLLCEATTEFSSNCFQYASSSEFSTNASPEGKVKSFIYIGKTVLPVRIELTTSALLRMSKNFFKVHEITFKSVHAHNFYVVA